MTGEQKLAVGAQHARLGRRLERRLAHDLAGLQVDRPERAMGGHAALLGAAWRQADVVLVLIHRGLAGGTRDAALGAGDVGNAALGVQGRREEGRRAVPPGAGLFTALAAPHADAGIGLYVLGRIVVDRLAGLRIDALRPGNLLLILVGADELA